MIEIVSQSLASLTGLQKEVLQQVDSLKCSGNLLFIHTFKLSIDNAIRHVREEIKSNVFHKN